MRELGKIGERVTWVKKGESERAMRWKKGEWIHEMEREWIRENGESERLDKNEERWD